MLYDFKTRETLDFLRFNNNDVINNLDLEVVNNSSRLREALEVVNNLDYYINESANIVSYSNLLEATSYSNLLEATNF